MQEQPSLCRGRGLPRRLRAALQRLSGRGRGRRARGTLETLGAAHPAAPGAGRRQRGLRGHTQGGSVPASPLLRPGPLLPGAPCCPLSAPWVVPAPPYSGWANPLCGCLLPCCPLRPAWGSREGPAPQGREPRSMRRCSQPRGEPLLTALLPAALLPDAPVPGRDRREAQQCPLLHRLRW